MLALARGEGQSIIIDGTIEVKVVKWSRSSVRLAIQAPRTVTVDRDEIWRKMHPGAPTPLEIAEKERNERFAREGPPPPRPHPGETLVLAPAAGVYGNAPANGGRPYVVIGSAVDVDTLVGTIQAGDGGITELRAGLKGSVVRVHAANGQMLAAGDAVIAVRAA